jgi:hypothetical protein
VSGFRRQQENLGRPTLTDADIKAITDSVVMGMLEAPHGVEVTLRRPDGKLFSTLLGGVPRPGDHLWLPLRRNGKPKRWQVERVEWFVEWPHRSVEVVLSEAPREVPATRSE